MAHARSNLELCQHLNHCGRNFMKALGMLLGTIAEHACKVCGSVAASYGIQGHVCLPISKPRQQAFDPLQMLACNIHISAAMLPVCMKFSFWSTADLHWSSQIEQQLNVHTALFKPQCHLPDFAGKHQQCGMEAAVLLGRGQTEAQNCGDCYSPFLTTHRSQFFLAVPTCASGFC